MSEPKLIRIYLIHGTWAKKAKWTLPNSKMHNLLKEAFCKANIVQHEWTGKNKIQDRHDATLQLINRIKSTNIPTFLIGHSHGGNIALNTLSEENINVSGIISLNTPFFYVLNKDFTWILRWTLFCIFLLCAIITCYKTFIFTKFYAKEYFNIANIDIPAFTGYIATILFLLTALIAGKIANFLGRKSAENTFSTIEKMVPTLHKKTNLLCLSTGDDEIFEGLSLLDNLANFTTFLLLGKWSMRFFLPVIFIVTILYLYYNNILVENLEFNFFLKSLFETELSNINTILLFGIIASPFLLFVFYTIAVVISVLLSFLLRGISQGNIKMSWLHLYKRIIITPSPMNYPKAKLKQIAPENRNTLSHSALYEDEKCIKEIINLIKNTI